MGDCSWICFRHRGLMAGQATEASLEMVGTRDPLAFRLATCRCRQTGCSCGRGRRNSCTSGSTAVTVTRWGRGSSVCCGALEAWASRRWRSRSLRERPSEAAGVEAIDILHCSPCLSPRHVAICASNSTLHPSVGNAGPRPSGGERDREDIVKMPCCTDRTSVAAGICAPTSAPPTRRLFQSIRSNPQAIMPPHAGAGGRPDGRDT
jgi:hypothetical protein